MPGARTLIDRACSAPSPDLDPKSLDPKTASRSWHSFAARGSGQTRKRVVYRPVEAPAALTPVALACRTVILMLRDSVSTSSATNIASIHLRPSQVLQIGDRDNDAADLLRDQPYNAASVVVLGDSLLPGQQS